MSGSREDKLLGAMLAYEMKGKHTATFMQLSKDLDFHDRTKTWRNSWKSLMDDRGFIELAAGAASVFTGECLMTQAGKEHAATDEYREFLKEMDFVPQDNEQHQARIKKKLLNDRARDIFDLLMKHGSLSRYEMATILQMNDRSHTFSYGLKDLKTKNLLTGDGNKIRLSNEAFLSPEDRPETVDVDPKVIKECRAIIEGKKKMRSNKGVCDSITKKVKKEGASVKTEDEEEKSAEEVRSVEKVKEKKVKTET